MLGPNWFLLGFAWGMSLVAAYRLGRLIALVQVAKPLNEGDKR